MSATNEKTYLTTGELAERWNMSAATLRSWRFKKMGPPYFKPAGTNGKALYRLTEIEVYEQGRTGGGEA